MSICQKSTDRLQSVGGKVSDERIAFDSAIIFSRIPQILAEINLSIYLDGM
jgi:hypothetical protein